MPLPLMVSLHLTFPVRFAFANGTRWLTSLSLERTNWCHCMYLNEITSVVFHPDIRHRPIGQSLGELGPSLDKLVWNLPKFEVFCHFLASDFAYKRDNISHRQWWSCGLQFFGYKFGSSRKLGFWVIYQHWLIRFFLYCFPIIFNYV